jgi:hypothetical protein
VLNKSLQLIRNVLGGLTRETRHNEISTITLVGQSMARLAQVKLGIDAASMRHGWHDDRQDRRLHRQF